MESIQELLRKLCKCIVKSDDGYKINIELEKSDPEPGPEPEPGPDPEIDPNSPEAKFDANIPLFIENAQDTPIYFGMACLSEDVNNRNISYSYDNITWQPLIFTKDSSSSPYISGNIILYKKGDRAYFKGEAANGLVSGTIYPAMFTTRGILKECCIDVGGNITSLFYGKDDKFKTDYLDLSNITHTSSDSLIGGLFGLPGTSGGSSLSSYIRTPPALPATTLCPGCYKYFFYNNIESGSAHLEYIPVLPAKKLETGCYYGMFFARSYNTVSEKSDRFYCYTILAEDITKSGFENTFFHAKYFKIINPDIIPKLKAATGGSTDRLDKHGIIYCPNDPGNKLPTGWKWVKIPPLE